MTLNEAWTDAQFEKYVDELVLEMRRDIKATFYFTNTESFSAVVDFPSVSDDPPEVHIGHWSSTSNPDPSRDPDWVVATSSPMRIKELREAFGLPSNPANTESAIASPSGYISCSGLPGTQDSLVHRSADGRFFSEHIGDHYAVIAVGRNLPPSRTIGLAEKECVSNLIKGWSDIARSARREYRWD